MKDIKDNKRNTPSIDPDMERELNLIIFLGIGPQKHAASFHLDYLSVFVCLSIHPMWLAGNAKSHPLQESTQIRFVQTRFLPLPVGTYFGLLSLACSPIRSWPILRISVCWNRLELRVLMPVNCHYIHFSRELRTHHSFSFPRTPLIVHFRKQRRILLAALFLVTRECWLTGNQYLMFQFEY